jgi:hypothetical protein
MNAGGGSGSPSSLPFPMQLPDMPWSCMNSDVLVNVVEGEPVPVPATATVTGLVSVHGVS